MNPVSESPSHEDDGFLLKNPPTDRHIRSVLHHEHGFPVDDLKNLEAKGWNPQEILQAYAAGYLDKNSILSMNPWSKRYLQEGHLWGDEPSDTVRILEHEFAAGNVNRRVLEFGFGYGRDLIHLVQQGHMVHGIEQSLVGINEATRTLRRLGLSSSENVTFTRSSIRSHALASEFYEAVMSHRVIHLIHPRYYPRLCDIFANTLISGGFAVISARNTEDYNPDQMQLLDQNGNPVNSNDSSSQEIRTASYKRREKHVINFFDARRFIEVFSRRFEIVDLYKGREPESCSNVIDGIPIMSNYTVAVMRKRKTNGFTSLDTSTTQGFEPPKVQALASYRLEAA